MDYLSIISIVLSVVILLTILFKKSNDDVLKNEMAINRKENAEGSMLMRDELSKRINEFNMQINERLTQASDSQNKQLNNITQSIEQKVDMLKSTVDKRLLDIQKDNEEKLEKMRLTVDEKLHKTLEARLGESFKTVSERLEEVHKGLGEMRSLAVGVGDLKKVLSNVKTRGILGEIQLENILEQIFAPEQYEKNIATVPNSREVVEFAIKMPGKDDGVGYTYLPIDSKFPTAIYEQLLDAYDTGDTNAIAQLSKELETVIKKSAKDIKDKYISVPYTTDFGVMFLPIEGLFAEVLRRNGLVEYLQREYKIAVTGPTTLAAFLNSLQMGFRTIAIEKRSSQVWEILGAVKTEFVKFEDVLQAAQKKLVGAGEEIDKLVGVRSRSIMRKLNTVATLPEEKATELLPNDE